MRKPVDISNQKFGRLVAVKPSHSTSVGVVWLFKCDCGQDHYRLAKAIRSNGAKASCGCWQKEIHSNRMKSFNTIHGMTESPTWYSWLAMRQRCENPNVAKFHHYGGRGIKVCNAWKDFTVFLRDMGERPLGKTIDRIDVDGMYEPSNCRWATALEQRHNRRSHLILPTSS